MSEILSRINILLTIVALLLLSSLIFYPLIEILFLSLHEGTIGKTTEDGLTLQNYIHIFEQPLYFTIFLRTLKISFLVTFFCILLGYPLAHFLSRIEKRVGILLLMIILVSLWINELIRSYAWMVLLQEKGLLNSMLLFAGIVSNPINLLGNEVGVVVGMIHILLPFMILPILNSMNNIDEDLELAARGLGANSLQAFLSITLPLSLTGALTGSLLVFLIALGLYITPSLLGGPRVMVMTTLISQQILNISNWSFGSALSCSLLFIVFALVILFQKFLSFERLLGKM
jgi:ABC-type spermidine/putrescine transport system permease subunit I